MINPNQSIKASQFSDIPLIAETTIEIAQSIGFITKNSFLSEHLQHLDVHILSKILQDMMVENVKLRTENADLKNQVRDLSNEVRHDPKTGLWNKKGLEEKVMERLSSQATFRRDSDPKLVGEKKDFLIFIDLCDFKKINDTYGHEIGDEAIQLTARILKAHWRKSDIVSRIGGDEFCILVPSIHPNILEQKIGKLRKAFQSNPLFSETSQGNPVLFPIKPAIGYAVADRDNINFCEWIHAADQAMYQDKYRLKKNKSSDITLKL